MRLAHRVWLTGFGWLAIITGFVYFKCKDKSTGFKRGHIYEARQLQVLDLKYNSWFIAGLSHSRIYLGNLAGALDLLSCNYKLKDTLSQRVPFSYNEKVDWRLARLKVDSPMVYLYEYKTPAVVTAVTPFAQEKYYPLAGMHFDLMQLLSPGSLIVNAYEPALRQKFVQKVWLNNKPHIDSCKRYGHQLQRGGNFSIDGFISCNRRQNAVLFTYYYRNQFICLDTNLNLRYIGKTIDTNTVAKLKVEELEVNGKRVQTISGTPLIISKRGYSDGNFIYLQAGLKADNEKLKLFEQRITLDVYRLNDGAYWHSIYLPEYKFEPLSDFAVRGNMLIALYGKYMVTYSINIKKIKLTGYAK
ncbi:hypothetical protein ABIE26_005349 [Pedobacter africanus]|uniref:Uncharacterized protein n=1 Tax=Pedobacter africanus TaxID=151894 RepID=A0ACC6L530_9SPHI|nr:hypothetical protein [Pedobacter africanus]MDR6786464.1 hypothetical protein [Pedobacter africanus]